MKNFIDIIDSHTNNEISEEVTQAGLVTFVIAGMIYCLALLA